MNALWLTVGQIPLLPWQGAPAKTPIRRILRGFFLLVWSSQVSPGEDIPPFLVWVGYIPEKKGLAAPAMAVGGSISPAGSSWCVGEHMLCIEVLWGQARAQTPQCTCFARTVVSVTWSRSATWAGPLPSEDLPPGSPPRGGSTAEAGMPLMCLSWLLGQIHCPPSWSLSRDAQWAEGLTSLLSWGGVAKAHTNLWPTTATSGLPEKGLLSASRLLWICNLPQRNLFNSSPPKIKGTHGQAITPQARTYFSQRIPLPTCILSAPSPGKFHLLILGSRRSRRHHSQPASRQHTLAAPSSLPCCRAPTLAVHLVPLSPVFPKQPPSQGLELRHPSSSLSAWLSVSVRGNVFYPSHCFLFPAWLL